MEQNIRLDVNHMMADMLGSEYGVTQAQLAAMQDAAVKAQHAVEANRGTGWLGWMNLPYNQEEIVSEIEKVADHVRKTFKYFVVLGIGGSALGPIAVHQALNHLHYNELPDSKRPGPKFYVEDNIDPERMAALMDVIELDKACFCIISKSGGTAETMSQYLIVTEALKAQVGADWAKHIIAVTDHEKGNLIKLAKENGFITFYIPDGVGGRFSEMCPVGLVPAACCGIDIRAMLKGAAAMDERCKTDDMMKNPALLEAVLQYIACEQMGRNVQVMLPYADSLKYMADWFCQLWAESLGKNKRRDGSDCHAGQTPAKALGVTDQHSQLQLYNEGPFDKVITFIKVENFRAETKIPKGCEEFKDVAFLGGMTHNTLIEAERQGTEYALYVNRRMNQTIIMPEVNAYTLGQLMFLLEMTTAYEGELLNIDAFNQPGVETSKRATYAILGNTDAKYDAPRLSRSIFCNQRGRSNPPPVFKEESQMSKIDTVRAAMMQAMKDKDKERKDALSLLLSALKSKQIDKRADLTEEEENAVIFREIKQAQETIDTTPADRVQTIEEAKLRMKVYGEFVPKLMDEDEIRAIIKEVLAELQIDQPTVKDKGRIMKTLMPRVKGKADGGLVNQVLGSFFA